MNKLVRRSLEILGKSVKSVGEDYTSNLTSFINDAKTVREQMTKTGTDVSDTIAKLKTTDITKKISDWFYQEENSYDASQGDEFDAGFSINSSDDTKLDGEKKPRQLDFEAMTEVAEKQSNTFLKIGRRQTEQSVANTAEIISVVNTRTSEMTTAINNINKTLTGISERLDKIIELQAVPLTTEQKEIDKGDIYSDGQLSLARIFEQSKKSFLEGGSNNAAIGGVMQVISTLSGTGGMLGPEDLAKMGLGLVTGKKMDALGGKSIDELGHKFNDMIGAGVQTALNEMINSGPFKSLFGDITRTEAEADYGKIVPNKYDNKKALFDGMVHQSIVNVIPEMLAKINESISGTSYHLDNRGNWQKGPVKNEFREVGKQAVASSGLTQNAVSGAIDKASKVTGQAVSSEDIEYASRALVGAIVHYMYTKGQRSFTLSMLKGDMSVHIENACKMLCTSYNDPLYWSQICQSVCIQLSMGLLDSSKFIQNINQSLKNLQDEAVRFAQSGKQNAKQASKISLDMIAESLYNDMSPAYADKNRSKIETPNPSNGGTNTDGRIQKNDTDEWTVGKFTTAEYVRSIFGILNRGINVKVVSDKHKGYDKYNIRTDDPENPKSSDEKFAKLFMQMGGVGSGENAKDFKGIIKQGMSDALGDLTNGNAGDLTQAAGSIGGLLTGSGGFMSNMMGILGASSIRSLASKAVNGTLVSDVKGLFGEGGKLREMGTNLKNRALGIKDQAMDHLPASMKYDRRTRQITDAVVGEDGIVRNGIDRAREGLSSGLNGARERVSDFLDNHQSIGRPLRRARDTVDAIKNNQLYQHESRVLRDSEDTLNNIDTDTIENFEDRMAAEAALMYFKRGDLENAEIEASKIETEDLRELILDKVKKIKEITKKREDGQAAVENGETPDIGAVIRDMPAAQPISDEEAEKKGGLIGVVARGFGKTIKGFAKVTAKITGAVLKASAKLVSSGTADLLIGLKNMGSGMKEIHQFNKELRGKIGGAVKSLATKAKDAVKSKTDGVKITHDRTNNVDKTLTDLLKHPVKTVGNCFKNVAADIKNSKLGEGVTNLGKSFKDSKLGEALDKLKKKITGVNDAETGEHKPGLKERAGAKFRSTAFGAGFMKSWDESKAAKKKLDEATERASTYINRTAGSILDILTGKEALGDHSPFQEICDIITGIRDDMNANHEEDVENSQGSEDETESEVTGAISDNVSEIVSGSTGAEGASGAAEGAVNALGGASSGAAGAASGAAGAAGAAGGAASGVAGAAAGAAGGAAGGISGLLGSIGKTLGGMSTAIMGIAKIALGIIMGMEGFQAILNTVEEVLKAILQPINKIFVTLKKFIDILIEPLQEALTTIVESIVTIVNQLLDAIKPILELVGDILDKLLNEALMPLVGMVLDMIMKILMPIMDKVINILTPVVEGIGGAVEVISGVLQLGMGIIIGMLGALMKLGGGILTGLSWLPGIGGDLGEKGEEMQSKADDMLTTAGGLITAGFDQMKHGLETMASSAVRALQAILPGGKDGTEGKEDKKDTGADTDQIHVGTDFGAGDVNTNTVNNSWSYTYGSGNTTMNQHSYGNYMNMSERGCGPVALADAFNRRNGGHMNPASLASSMMGSGAYEPARGTSVRSMISTGNSLGMGTRLGGVTQASLKRATPTNPVTVLGSGAGFGTKSGNSHYVNVVGTDSHGGAYVSNPMSGRVERQSLSQLALNSKLGLYGSGDIDLDAYGIDEDTSESLKKLKELTGKLTTMFTGSTGGDIDAMAKYNELKAKAENIKKEIGEEEYNKLVESGKQELMTKYPKKEGETDEEYEARINKKWEKEQYEYIVKNGSETAIDNYTKLTNAIRDAASETIAHHNANMESVKAWSVSGKKGGGEDTIYAYMSEFSPIEYYKNEIDGATSGKSPLHNYFAATSGSAFDDDKKLVSMMTINGGWYGHADNPDEKGEGSSGAETTGVKISHSSKERMTVRAITPGTVVAVTDDKSPYGKSVKFKDAVGMYHWYMNLASIADGIEENANLDENAEIGMLGYDDGSTDLTLRDDLKTQATKVAEDVGKQIAKVVSSNDSEEKIKEKAEKDKTVNDAVGAAATTMMTTAAGALGAVDSNAAAGAAAALVQAAMGQLEADPKKRQTLQYVLTKKEEGGPGEEGSMNPFEYWEFVEDGANGNNAGPYKKTASMTGGFWCSTYEDKLKKCDYHQQAQKAGLTGAQEAMIAAIAIHEDGAQKITGEKSITKVTADYNGQTAFGIMNWIPDPANRYVGATETKYGTTLAEQLPEMRKMYFDKSPTHDRAKINASNLAQYSAGMQKALGHAPTLKGGDPWGPLAESDIAESMGHFVGNALVPACWDTAEGQGKHMATAVDAYNWMIEQGWIKVGGGANSENKGKEGEEGEEEDKKRKGRFRSTVFIKGKGSGSGTGDGYFVSDGGVALANYGEPEITETNITGVPSGNSPIHEFFGKTTNGTTQSGSANWYGQRDNPNTEGQGSSGGGHGGIDIWWSSGNTEGQELHATCGGTVDRSEGGASPADGSNGGCGNNIRWLDDAGYLHWYMHMQKDPEFKKGDTIEPGDLVGYAGNTGGSCGAHLHYNINNSEGFDGWSSSQAVNPLTYFCNYNSSGGGGSVVSSSGSSSSSDDDSSGSSSSSSSGGGSKVAGSSAGSGRTGTVTTSSTALNMRSGPSVNDSKIGSIPNGSTVTILGDAAGGWKHIKYGGKEGYVSGSYITEGEAGTITYKSGSTKDLTQMGPQNYVNISDWKKGGSNFKQAAKTWLANHHTYYTNTRDGRFYKSYYDKENGASVNGSGAGTTQYWTTMSNDYSKKNNKGQTMSNHLAYMKNALNVKGAGDVDDTNIGIDTNNFWYNELFSQAQQPVQNDIPALDPNDFATDTTQYDGFSTLNNFVQKYEIKSDPSVNIDMLDKMSKMTFNVRAERVEELLEELIKKVSGEEPTPSTSGTDTNLFKNDQIPAQITRLSRG